MGHILSEPTARWLITELCRTSLLVAVLGLAAWLVLRLARINSPTLHRTCCVITLLAGWAFARYPVNVTWYETPVAAIEEATVETESFTPPIDPSLLIPPPEFGATVSDGPTLFVEQDVRSQIATAEGPNRHPAPFPEPAAVVSREPVSDTSWSLLAVTAWGLGMTIIAAYWLLGYLHFLSRLPHSEAGKAEWEAEFTALRAEQGRGQRLEFRITEDTGPLLCRTPRRAVLLVPRSLWNELTPHERRAILRHELEHLSRGDLWKSLVVRVLAIPHWFNPVAWLAVGRFDDAAEWACDRAAMGGEPTTYAAMLLRLGELASGHVRFGSAMSNRPLTNRIRRLLTITRTEDSAMKKACLVSLLLLVAPLALVRVNLVAEEPAQNDAAPPSQTNQGADNLFQDMPPSQASASETDSPPTEQTSPRVNSPDDSPVRAAKKKMLKMAKDTYTTNYENAQAGYAVFDLDEAIRWSNLWLSAELALAETREQQLAAAQANLERIKTVQAAVQQLFDTGSKGGETGKLSAANYYVADAERRLAEIEAMPVPVEVSRRPATNRELVETAERGFESTEAAYLAGNAPLESLISWSNRWLAAELEVAQSGKQQLAATQAHLERIKHIHTKIEALFRTGSKGGDANLMATADYYLADAKRQLAEIERRLNTSDAAVIAKPNTNQALASPRRPDENRQPTLSLAPNAPPQSKKQTHTDPIQRHSVTPAAIRPQYYDGKTFTQWRTQLKTDLSPVVRKEALDAMGVFAAHGYGQEAAELVFDVMRDYSVWTLFEDSPEGHLKTAAVEAAMRIPAAERLPAVIEALSTGNKNQKLFALRIVPLDAPKAEIVPSLVTALGAKDRQIVDLARMPLVLIDHDNPELIASIRRGLASTDPDEILNAVWMARGGPHSVPGPMAVVSEPFPELVPLALELLDHESPAIRQNASNALTSSVVGPPQLHYVLVLEQIASSGNGADAVNAAKILDRLRPDALERRR